MAKENIAKVVPQEEVEGEYDKKPLETVVKKMLDKQEIEDLKGTDVSKKGFTNDELIEVIAEKFNDVPSKSAMLKLLRSEGHSVAQNRCYNAYLQVAMAIEKKAKEAK